MGRQPVIATRAQDGSIQVLANRCTHRGNRICNAEAGNASSFRCEYHGWTFANDGRLMAIPMRQGYGERFDEVRDSLGLSHARVDAYGGFIFATFAVEGISLMQHLGRATTAIDRLLRLSPTGELNLRAGWMKHYQRCNWKMVQENNVDGYHGMFTHGSLFGGLKTPKVALQPSKVDVRVRALGNGHAELDWAEEYKKLNEEFVWFRRTPRSAFPQYVDKMEEHWGVEAAREAFVVGPPHTLIFPNLFIAEMNIMFVEPLAPGETIAYTTPALLKGAPEMDSRLIRRREGGLGPAGFLIADDGEIAARNQLGVAANQPEWITLSRGWETEYVDETGTVNTDKSAETSLRGFWSHWAEVVGADR
jgi:phenylpropionate dioxygenase-like ring-hydroxylating dioxygenase large terminal subunit